MRLFKSFFSNGNNIAITDGETLNLSYRDLIVQSNSIKKQIKHKSLILIISENDIGSLIAYVFCIINNHVAIIVDSKTKKKEIYNILTNYNPNYIFTSKKNRSIFQNRCVEKYTFFNEILLKNKNFKKKNLNKDLSLLLSTSGSIGAVKFVKLSKSNLKYNTDSIIKYLKIKKNDCSITNLPISYSYMLSVINTHFEKGGSIVICNNSLIEKKFWEVFKKNKITSFNGVPYTYEILRKIGLKNIKNKSMKYLTQAGGKLEKDKLREIIKFCDNNNLKFYSMYGQTEASPRISYLRPELIKKKAGSIGKAIPGNLIYLINEYGKKILKPFEPGEIVCEGKNIFMGYSENCEDLKFKDKNKFKLLTGDLGYFDNDGFFYLTGRKSRIAKIFGNRVDLDTLESLMVQKGYKIACISDDKKIFVYVENKYNKERLINTISKITSFNIRSFELIKLKYFPRTSNKKISYNELKKINVRL
tara:strand:- start:40 stop:1461 length:1422 start_codon:yes stop_codon:yes gene_type:complete